jgi:hypothetical protein
MIKLKQWLLGGGGLLLSALVKEISGLPLNLRLNPRLVGGDLLLSALIFRWCVLSYSACHPLPVQLRADGGTSCGVFFLTRHVT